MAEVGDGQAPAVTRTQTFSGSGLAILRSHGGPDRPSSSFTHLSATFPLKLICPRTSSKDAGLRIARHTDQKIAQRQVHAIAALYVVGYGGGLVSGDRISIDFDVGQKCTLLLLTQGSTKVFKIRGGKRADLSHISNLPSTSQHFRCIVRREATLVILPDPVTCFADSQYRQRQQVDLRCPTSSSLVLLDWFTPGRQHLANKNGTAVRNEAWEFSSYKSHNEIRLGQRVIARDIALLERDTANNIAEKCEPYTCFAALFLVGCEVAEVVAAIKADFYQIQQGSKQQSHQRPSLAAAPLIWSCTSLGEEGEHDIGRQDKQNSIVVRLAGTSTEIVRTWLRLSLAPIRNLVGDDLYRQALGS